MSLKDQLKYAPADFSLFEKSGYGLLYEAYSALNRFKTVLRRSMLIDQDKYPTWSNVNLFRPNSHDLVEVYAYWAMSTDMVKRRLSYMSTEDLAMHEALDRKPKRGLDLPADFSVEKANLQYAELTGKLKAWEMNGGEYIYPALNRHLEGRIQDWEKHLGYAEADPEYLNGVETMESPNDFCNERTLLEYAKEAIIELILDDYLPYFPEYVKKLAELDIRFKKVIKGKHWVQPWADTDLWWHQPE